MPINPELKHLYPADWPEIRKEILERAKHKCEFCGVPNHARGWRDKGGKFHNLADYDLDTIDALNDFDEWDADDVILIVLTIAHLDHNPAHNDRPKFLNLAALCQQCHNRHDAAHRARNRSRSRDRRRGQERLFDAP